MEETIDKSKLALCGRFIFYELPHLKANFRSFGAKAKAEPNRHFGFLILINDVWVT